MSQHPRTARARTVPALAIFATAFVVLGAQGRDLTWTEDDWSGGAYASAARVDADIQPGILVLENLPGDMRSLASPTAFQGLYSMAVLHDTLWITASDYPYQFDGAEVIHYDYLTGQFEVDYQPYESGLHLIKRFGDSLYVPGPDSRDPHSSPGSIYLYTGRQWIDKATLPMAIHINDVEVANGITYATVGHPDGTYHLCGIVWTSHDYGDTFSQSLTLWPNAQAPVRRFFGAGSIGDRVFVQPDGFAPESDVVYSTTNGTDWNTIPVPGLPEDKQAMFTVWGDSLLMTIHNRMYIWDGEQFHGYWLPFQGYRWCRGIEKYKGRLYGGALGGTLYRWLQRSQWETISQVSLEPATEEIEAMATYYGRLYISTSRPEQGMIPRLYVSAAVPLGVMVSRVHDFGEPVGNGEVVWAGFTPGATGDLRFQVRSGVTEGQVPAALFLGPDGQPNSYYTIPGMPLAPAHHGHRYFQYKVELLCPDGLNMPILDSVTLRADTLDAAAVAEGDPTRGNGALEPGDRPRSGVLAFAPPQPNPARGPLSLRVDLSGGELLPGLARPLPAVELAVVDLEGRLVRRATMIPASDGTASWFWDLCDEQGHRVPGGVYRAMACAAGAPGPVIVRSLVVLP